MEFGVVQIVGQFNTFKVADSKFDVSMFHGRLRKFIVMVDYKTN